MRVLVDIVENLTSSVRFVVGALVMAGLGIGLIFAITMSLAAPKAADAMEKFGDKALKVAQDEARAHAMAGEGWGYGAPAAGAPLPADHSDVSDGSDSGDGWAR